MDMHHHVMIGHGQAVNSVRLRDDQPEFHQPPVRASLSAPLTGFSGVGLLAGWDEADRDTASFEVGLFLPPPPLFLPPSVSFVSSYYKVSHPNGTPTMSLRVCVHVCICACDRRVH